MTKKFFDDKRIKNKLIKDIENEFIQEQKLIIINIIKNKHFIYFILNII